MTKRHVSENDTLQKIVCTFFIEAGIMVFLQRITFSYCKRYIGEKFSIFRNGQ